VLVAAAPTEVALIEIDFTRELVLLGADDPDSRMLRRAATRQRFNPRDFDLGNKLRLVDGEHDVFGDGSVVCLPPHGHTPGHQSLRLRLDRGEVVLAADACYFRQTLRERCLPRNMYDREAMLASLDRLEALERSGARIFFGHDPEFWHTAPSIICPAHREGTIRPSRIVGYQCRTPTPIFRVRASQPETISQIVASRPT